MDFRVSNGLQKINDYREQNLHVFSIRYITVVESHDHSQNI